MADKLTTPGMLMVNMALPSDLRSDSIRLDKKSIATLLEQVALKYPEKYPEILKSLTQLGARVASDTGASISGFALQDSPERQALAAELDQKVQDLRHVVKDDKEFQKQVVVLAESYRKKFQDVAMMNGERVSDPLYEQLKSGARGNSTQYSSMVGADVLVTDHTGNPVAVPITRNYSVGLSPAEYFASLYGTRKGLIDTKFSVGEAGFFAKKLANTLHRLVVTDDEPIAHRLPVGLPSSSTDPDIIGSVLAEDVGPYKARTIITPKIAQGIAAIKPN